MKGKVAVVTGAGRGIGQGIATTLAARGVAVAVNDMHGDRCREVVEQIRAAGGTAAAFECDVTDLAAVEAMAAAVADELGPADILVNNAGIPETFIPKKFRDSSPEDWDPFIRVNLYGVFHCVRAFADSMCERSWGRIVTISSEAWRTGTPMGISMYAAGKAGAIGFMRQLSAELGDEGVTVNCVALGEMSNIPLPESHWNRYPIKRAGTPDDVGSLVAFLASDEASWITGQVVALNGGLVTS